MLRGKFDSTNQKHYPDLGSDASSVWNFCTRFSDLIWRGNRCQRCQMSAVFSGYLFQSYYHFLLIFRNLVSPQYRHQAKCGEMQWLVDGVYQGVTCKQVHWCPISGKTFASQQISVPEGEPLIFKFLVFTDQHSDLIPVD